MYGFLNVLGQCPSVELIFLTEVKENLSNKIDGWGHIASNQHAEYFCDVIFECMFYFLNVVMAMLFSWVQFDPKFSWRKWKKINKYQSSKTTIFMKCI